jgi:hypothetical protein
MAKEVYWSRQDVMRLLGVKKSALKFYEDEGAPCFIEAKGGYPAKEYCQFIVSRPRKSKGPDKTNIRQLAQQYLMSIGVHPTASAPLTADTTPNKVGRGRGKKDPVTTDPPKNIKKIDKLLPGMMAALDRAREAEVVAYQMYNDALTQTGVISVNSLGSWQATLDILRKCETDFSRVLERQRLLIEKKEVQDWLEPMIEQTKTMLLNLPAKLAPSLEGLPWHEIQQRLDQEIRDVITKLTNFS